MKRSSGTELSPRSENPAKPRIRSRDQGPIIEAVLNAAKHAGLTHGELARRSGLPRSAVTGILSGSLQKITIAAFLSSWKPPNSFPRSGFEARREGVCGHALPLSSRRVGCGVG